MRLTLALHASMAVKRTVGKALVVGAATGGFVGFIPVAPGTAGSVVGAILAWQWASLPIWLHILSVAGLSLAGSWVCSRATQVFRKADAPQIVIDEIVGMLVTMIGVPMTSYWIVWGFVLFRFFDVAKIPPADYFDRKVKTGFGVMMDDVVSGIYACTVLHLMVRAAV